MFSRTSWSTSSVRKATEAFSRTFGKARIEIQEKTPPLELHFDVVSLGSASLVRNTLGPEVTLFCERTRDYLFTVARKGHSDFHLDGKKFHCNRSRGIMLSPVTNLSIHRSRGSENTILKMDQAAVHTTLMALTGEKVSRPVIFKSEVNIRSGAGASMRRLIEHVFEEVKRGDTGMAVPQVANTTSRALITDVLYLLKHDYSEKLAGHQGVALMSVVRRVEEFIEQNYQKSISNRILADIGGKSVSMLYRIFMKQRPYTPMQYLRRTRMLHARKRLLSPRPGDTVTSIALECGFMHFSRFASNYRKHYGEHPSGTLSRVRSG